MRTITIWLIRLNIKIAERKLSKIEEDVIERAYNYMIKNYKDTITYLKAQRHASFVALKNKLSIN